MCDVCSGAVRGARVEVTGAAQALIALVRAACAKKGGKGGGRITHRALAEAFVKAHKKGMKGVKGKQEGDASGGVHLLEPETVGRLINQLALESVLGEDFAASMYTINSYVVVGYQVG